MYTKVLLSKDQGDSIRAFVLSSHHRRSTILGRSRKDLSDSRSESQFGTKSYNDALQRSFNRAKQQVFFNPDMTKFVTLTYAGIVDDVDKVLHDVKMFVKAERRQNHDLKYIYVLEWQKRGSLHVHMITNSQLTTYTNKNGHPSLTYWSHGFSSVLTVNDFDDNFRPHLYLFKYMKKAQRIGKSFLHSSRNLNNFKEVNTPPLNLHNWSLLTQERSIAKMPNGKRLVFNKYYLKYDKLESLSKHRIAVKEYAKWQKVILHSTKVRPKKTENHLQH